jgi:membrane-associated phospholipid phosphatase
VGKIQISILIALSLLFVGGIDAQEKFTWSELGKDLASPVTTPANVLLLGGIVSTGLVYINTKQNTYRKRVSFDDARPLGDYGFIGDYVGYGLLNVSYVLGHWIYGATYDRTEHLKNAELMARASIYATLVTNLMKLGIYEKRPGYPDDHHSFPSGHSAASFAFASVVTANHGWIWGGLAHLGATFIAVSRINDDFHYLHDVTAGITIGISYGWGVYHRHQKGSPYLFSAYPVKDGAGLIVGRSY